MGALWSFGLPSEKWVKAERTYLQEKASYVNFINRNQDKRIIGNSVTIAFTFTSISF